MGNAVRLVIPFKGLSLGLHSFDFELGDSFFAQYENAIVQRGKLAVHVELSKLSSLLDCDVSISGAVAVECDRCLDEFDLPIDYQGKLMVSLSGHKGSDYENEDEDVELIYLRPSDDELDISVYCYESIGLSLPLQKVHPDDADGNSTCNKGMLEKLKDLLVE